MAARPTFRVCHVCGTAYPDVASRSAHVAADHPGYRIEWEGRDPVVIDPEGNRRKLGKAEQARMRRAATAKPKTPRAATPRTIESLSPPADGTAPTVPADDLESGTPAGQAEPTPRRKRATVEQPYVRITPEYRAADMRATVAEAFTLDMLATILRDLSIALSEADGAGEDGYLSRIQAVQLANLLYDVTVDVIVNRFSGNVGRFKMALAAVLILASKGRIHGRAIGGRLTRARAERGAARHVAETIAAQEVPTEPPADPYVLDAAGDPIAALRVRQAADVGRRAD